jgi:hypothetical protein
MEEIAYFRCAHTIIAEELALKGNNRKAMRGLSKGLKIFYQNKTSQKKDMLNK